MRRADAKWATSSLAGLVGMPGDALYTATKHAVVGYVRSAAPTLAPEGIRVNAVCPGFADTPLIARVRDRFGEFPMLTADDVAGGIEDILERGEPGEPGALSSAIVTESFVGGRIPVPRAGMRSPTTSRPSRTGGS